VPGEVVGSGEEDLRCRSLFYSDRVFGNVYNKTFNLRLSSWWREVSGNLKRLR